MGPTAASIKTALATDDCVKFTSKLISIDSALFTKDGYQDGSQTLKKFIFAPLLDAIRMRATRPFDFRRDRWRKMRPGIVGGRF